MVSPPSFSYCSSIISKSYSSSVQSLPLDKAFLLFLIDWLAATVPPKLPTKMVSLYIVCCSCACRFNVVLVGQLSSYVRTIIVNVGLLGRYVNLLSWYYRAMFGLLSCDGRTIFVWFVMGLWLDEFNDNSTNHTNATRMSHEYTAITTRPFCNVFFPRFIV